MHRYLLAVALLAAIPVARAADLTISNAPTYNVTFSNGVYTASPTDPSNLNATELLLALTSQPITVRAGGGDIFLSVNIGWSTGTALRLEAFRNIALQTSSILNFAGGRISLRADSTGTGIGTVTSSGGNLSSSGLVEVFYNPTVFGTPNTIYTGGTTPIASMLVNTLTTLQNMSVNLAGNYALGRDIDASPTVNMNAGAGFAPIGTGIPFTGRFDGDNHAITGLFINRPTDDNDGLFGGVSGGTIRNVSLINVNVTGRIGVGALAGTVTSTTVITHASSSGKVTASTDFAGGLVGVMAGQSLTISKSSATVTSGGIAGGLVGHALQTGGSLLIADSYAIGTVRGNGSGSAGGLVGVAANAAVIDRCYSAGSVQATNAGGLVGGSSGGVTVTNAFWDTDTSGRATSFGGTGRTTLQMMQQATFPAFDFVNVWTIADGLTFPHFGVNDAPIVAITGTFATFTEGDNVASTPVTVSPAIVVYDVDSVTLSSAMVAITGRLTEAEDILAFINDGASMGNIAGAYDPSTGVLALTSNGATATSAQWQAALRAVTYTNKSEQPFAQPRLITFTASDGAATSLPVSTGLDVISTNDSPQILASSPRAATVGVPIQLGSIEFSDADAGGATVSVTLAIDSGLLSAVSTGSVIVAGTGTSMKLSGSIAGINSFIASHHVTFTGTNAAVVHLTIGIDDNGNSASGGLVPKTNSASVVINVVPAVPVLVSATATSETSITVTWMPAAGATGYAIYRTGSVAIGYSKVGDAASADTSFNDTNVAAGTSYLYTVAATGGPGPVVLSNRDIATTIVFDDPDLTNLPVKAVHILQLRTAVNAMMVAANQTPSFSTTDPTGSAITAQDINDLRTALNSARFSILLAPVTYTNSAPAADVTPIRAADFYDIRSGVE